MQQSPITGARHHSRCRSDNRQRRFAKPLTCRRLFAAGIAVALGISARAQGQLALPYSTSFESTPDAQGQTYSPGNLEGQNGWVTETGEPSGEASVTSATANSGTQSVRITSQSNGYADYYNADLADHVAGNGPGLSLNPALYGNQVAISFAMDHAAPTAGQTSSTSANRSAFGIDIIDSDDNIVASFYARELSNGTDALFVTNGDSEAGTQVTGSAGAGRSDGVWADYSLTLG
jgi:hypothetical protein